ncbi:hypothetical protein GTO10_03015, partial [Candidatus Saccharibacteria bacterium]|nr:hypothetical protein [Candidatus Saccharibacteria bacterium]
MAVPRTGTIYTAKKLRPKQPSAPGFFGRRKKPKTLLGWLGFFLEIIGRPLFWLLLTLGYCFIILLTSAKRFFILLSKQTVKLPKPPRVRLPKFPQIRLPKLPRLAPPRPSKKWLIPLGALGLILIASLAGFSIYWYIFKDLPHPQRLITRDQIVTTKIYDRHGELLYKIYHSQNRTLVPLSDIPLTLVQATVAIEDAEFYRHYGFSPKGIVRASLANLFSEKLYGGSTITQQLVKNALLTPEKTLQRKTKEIILALWVEAKFTKDEILQMYFNEVGYGGAAYGAEEAAQMYFGKSVKELDLAESALLAGLPASPA